MDDYQDKLDREKRWHSHNDFQHDHFLNSRLFYDEERNHWAYEFPKIRMARLIDRKLDRLGWSEPSMLIAPIGTGPDVPFLQPLAGEMVGIDISPEAIASLPEGVEGHVGDMRHMTAFPDRRFEVVVSPLFFHHFLNDFDSFLKEMWRVLKPGGLLVALEPSRLYPVSWVTRSLRRVVGNITGQVEDEAPFLPTKLSSAMRRCGFEDVRIAGASFSHNRFPKPIAVLNNKLTSGLLSVPVVNQFGWMCLFSGHRPVDPDSALN